MKNRSALHFVLIIGIANFFADFTYEGARAIIGPFLGSLGASAAIVGLVAGFGELMGYGLRSVSGYFADKSHRRTKALPPRSVCECLDQCALTLRGPRRLAPDGSSV